MRHQTYILIQEYKKSIQRDESEHLRKKDDELKDDNFTDENESNIERGVDFINWKFIHDKDSTNLIF